MQCPFCGQDNDKVVDSRAAEGGRAIRRRRLCLSCERRYTTYERPEDVIRLRVVKKDGSRVPYERRKVIDGLQKACYKRPVSDEQIRAILEAVEEELHREFDKDVPSQYIGDAVANRLRQLDKIAYVRFASVYRQFTDVGELINEARQVEDVAAPGPGQGSLFGGSRSRGTAEDKPPPEKE
jgi:transcriptional repressor NrdR